MAEIPAATAAGTGGAFSATSHRGFKEQLKKIYTWYTGGFILFVVVLAILLGIRLFLRGCATVAFGLGLRDLHSMTAPRVPT